jgi:hypothetical protein
MDETPVTGLNQKSAADYNRRANHMTTIRIKLPTIEEVDFTLEAEYEEISVRGNAMASGDDEQDKMYEDEIIRRLDNGDVWAWASVKVTAQWRGIEGVDYLGCCCYANENDFKQPGGYYDDMKQEAYDDLIAKINTLKG